MLIELIGTSFCEVAIDEGRSSVSGDLPPKIGPVFKLGLEYNIGITLKGGQDESEAIYDGTDYRFATGGGYKGFSRQERRADLPGDRDSRTDLLAMA